MQGYNKVAARRSFSVTFNHETKSNNNYKGGDDRKIDDAKNNSSKKPGCSFCGEQGHVSLFNCGGFKNVSMTARCRFVLSRRLCWRCLGEGHVARGCAIGTHIVR